MNSLRRTLVVGNWKMHLNVAQSSILVHRLNMSIKTHRNIEVVISPSTLALQPLSLEIDRRKFRLAIQDAHPKDEGAFTGEVSFTMARGLVHYGIVGHSARRIYFNESLEMIRDKVAAAVRNGITPILCIGETKEERQNGETRRVLHDQIVTALHELTAEEIAGMVIAYEPVWAISTFDGEVAKPHVIQKELDHVRDQIRQLHGDMVARTVRILYGGSVDEFDARSYLELEGCDGVLVGAASLNYHKFTGIVDSAYRMVHSE
jgi:triosephosphate isomerase